MERLEGYGSWVVACLVAVALIGGYWLFAPPGDFPSGSVFVVTEGSSAPAVAAELGEAHIVAHPELLRLLLRFTDASGSIHAGTYRFDTPTDLFAVAYRLATGAYGLPPTRITFIEGAITRTMATQIAAAFPGISTDEFLAAAGPYEGYLFPDTYFFPPSSSADSVVETMRENFDEKMVPLKGDVAASGHALDDIVAMASIIEKEANDDTDRHLISGILWHRLALGMPLQVDAAPDTYKHKGLPAPICNPGLDALDAAVHPTATKYLYYLTGRDGLMHYATTFAGHQANLRRYGLATGK